MARNFFHEINYHLRQYLTPAVRWIILTCVGIFLLNYTILLALGLQNWFSMSFCQLPLFVIYKFQIWRLFTYMFLHFQPMHLLFNMMALWFFAPEIESRWGTKKFIKFFLVSGIGAALVHTLFTIVIGLIKARGFGDMFILSLYQPMIGISGFVYAVLIAYLIYFPDRTVMVNFLLPMKIKYFVSIIIAIAFLSSVGSASSSGAQDNVSHITHLGGALFGYIFIKYPTWMHRIRYGGPKKIKHPYYRDEDFR